MLSLWQEGMKKYCRQLKKDNKRNNGKNKAEGDDSDSDKIATVIYDMIVLCDNVVNVACCETS